MISCGISGSSRCFSPAAWRTSTQRPPDPTADAEIPQPDAGSEPQPDAAPPDPGRGLMATPRHGELLAGSTQQRIAVTGYLPAPGKRAFVQTLQSPDDLSTWTTVANALSADSPAEPGLYPFSLEFVPARWRQGALLRLRVLDERGVPLATFDRDSESCFSSQQAQSWRARLTACAVPLPAVILTSPTPGPGAAAPGPRYLDLRGLSDEAEVQTYYATIGAPLTLTAFRVLYGFDDPANVVSAYYYNAGDLGIGRSMHCTQAPGALACYVANFGVFGGNGDDALAATLAAAAAGNDSGAFATVAMVYRSPITAGNSVQFMVYSAAGGLVTSAPLDTHGDNTSIPNNCLNCHGGGTYDANNHRVLAARFLPFEPAGLSFGTAAPYRLADQQESLRKLNRMIRQSEPSAGLAEMIDSLYGGAGGVDRAGTVAQVDPVPAAWSEASAARVYRHVVRPYCAGCHASQQPTATRTTLDFGTAAGFRAMAAKIGSQVCGRAGDPASHAMPNAEVTLSRFWASPARAYMVGWLGLTGDCAP